MNHWHKTLIIIMYTSGEKGNTAIEETLDYQKGDVELWITDEHCEFRWSVETKREKREGSHFWG